MKQRADISYMLFLAVTAAVGGLLFGYDTAVISGTVELVTARFGLDSLQQGWYVGCALAGSVAGVLCAGVLSDRLGRRRTMLVSAVLFTVSAVGCALCADFTQLVVYRIVGGLGIGVVSIVSPLYISESGKGLGGGQTPQWRLLLSKGIRTACCWRRSYAMFSAAPSPSAPWYGCFCRRCIRFVCAAWRCRSRGSRFGRGPIWSGSLRRGCSRI